jgi:hypothetical protein
MSIFKLLRERGAKIGLLLLLAASLLTIPGVSAQAQRQQRNQQQRNQPPPEPPPPPPAQAPAPAQPAPRAAEEPPVPVRVVPSPKTEAELAAEQRQREQFSSIETKVTIFAGLVIAIGLLLAAVFAMQALFLWLGLRAMRRSAQLTERNLMTAQRAFVYLGSLSWSIADGSVAIVPVWENSGTTPTRSLRVNTNWRGWNGEMPGDFVHSYARPPDRLVLGSKGSAGLGTLLIPMRDIEAAIEQRAQLYVWGRATYEDIFEGSAPHFFEFCYRIDASGAALDAIELSFTQFGLHNRSDQDNVRADAS